MITVAVFTLLALAALIVLIYVVATLLRLLERAVSALETIAKSYAEENRVHR